MGLLIIALILVVLSRSQTATLRTDTSQPLPSPVLQAAAPTPPAATEAAAAAAPTPNESTGTTPTIPATAPAATAAPIGSPASASLPLGTLVEVDGWSATLLRPDYALILDGSIGDLKPAGRFVLTLIAISNNSPQPRHIPADLLTLVDSRGRRYSPALNASSAYLTLYGRGQHGDLALEDSLSPRSGMRSVPILFDVPADAAGLVLTVRDSGAAGWPIEDVVVPAVNVGP